jgi:RES domain-containing protein
MSDKPYQGALTAYRIVRAGYPVFDGSGAARWGGRWTGKGRAVIHAAESYALAVLENLVHFNASELPPHLVVCEIHIPEHVSRQIVRRSAVPDFDLDDSYAACRALGDRWHEEAKTALLIVPSRLSPYECNLLIHPLHKDISSMRVGEPLPARLDERLKGLLGKRRKPK